MGKISGFIVGFMLLMGPQKSLSYWNCLLLLSQIFLNKFTQVFIFKIYLPLLCNSFLKGCFRFQMPWQLL